MSTQSKLLISNGQFPVVTSRTPSPGPSCLWPGWGGQCTGPSRPGSTAPSPWGCSPPSLRSGLRSRKLICIKYHKYLPKIARGEYFPPGPTSMVSGRQGRIFLHYFFQEDHFWFSLFTQVTQFKMVSIVFRHFRQVIVIPYLECLVFDGGVNPAPVDVGDETNKSEN